MSEFTQGEWTYEPRRENIPFYSENGELIGIIYGCSSKSMANANLIVEAPAMYELLNRTLDFLVKHDIDDKLKTMRLSRQATTARREELGIAVILATVTANIRKTCTEKWEKCMNTAVHSTPNLTQSARPVKK